jgi:Cysteine rich repeat
MRTSTLSPIARLFALAVILDGLASPTFAQQPSQAQINAVRQACRSDYQSYCSSVPTGGSAALACLQQNAQSLSGPCQRAVSAVGSSAPSAQSQRPAAPGMPASGVPTAAAPASRPPPPPLSPRQEAFLLRRSCGPDFRAYCGDMAPGGGRIIACLEANGPSLSRQCRSALISARQAR